MVIMSSEEMWDEIEFMDTHMESAVLGDRIWDKTGITSPTAYSNRVITLSTFYPSGRCIKRPLMIKMSSWYLKYDPLTS